MELRRELRNWFLGLTGVGVFLLVLGVPAVIDPETSAFAALLVLVAIAILYLGLRVGQLLRTVVLLPDLIGSVQAVAYGRGADGGWLLQRPIMVAASTTELAVIRAGFRRPSSWHRISWGDVRAFSVEGESLERSLRITTPGGVHVVAGVKWTHAEDLDAAVAQLSDASQEPITPFEWSGPTGSQRRLANILVAVSVLLGVILLTAGNPSGVVWIVLPVALRWYARRRTQRPIARTKA